MKSGFRFIEHTADVIIEAWAPTLEGVFEYSAKAMYEVMTDISKVDKVIEKKVEAEGFDLENLLLRWLEELLSITDSEGILFSEFIVEKIEKMSEGYIVKSRCLGEEFNPEKHESRTEVKAVTYSQMRIWREDDLWKARFTLDI